CRPCAWWSRVFRPSWSWSSTTSWISEQLWPSRPPDCLLKFTQRGGACRVHSEDPQPASGSWLPECKRPSSSFLFPQAPQCLRLRSARRPVDELDGVDDGNSRYQFQLTHTTEVPSCNHIRRDAGNVCCFSLRKSTRNDRLKHVV